jgi:hypothetical protein
MYHLTQLICHAAQRMHLRLGKQLLRRKSLAALSERTDNARKHTFKGAYDEKCTVR